MWFLKLSYCVLWLKGYLCRMSSVLHLHRMRYWRCLTWWHWVPRSCVAWYSASLVRPTTIPGTRNGTWHTWEQATSQTSSSTKGVFYERFMCHGFLCSLWYLFIHVLDTLFLPLTLLHRSLFFFSFSLPLPPSTAWFPYQQDPLPHRHALGPFLHSRPHQRLWRATVLPTPQPKRSLTHNSSSS